MESELENNLTVGVREVNKCTSIAWGAVIAGTIVSLGYETLLNFLGIGLWLASLNSQNPHIFNLGSGATIWLAISGMVSMGIGGWFVGKFSGMHCAFKRGCHGVIAWSLAAFLTVIVATTASGAFMGGAISTMNMPNIQELSQTTSNTHGESTSTEPYSDNVQHDSDREIGTYVGNLGKVSIAIFLAFLMSGIASVAGAVWARPWTAKKDKDSKARY
jgi:hypothetical protein